MLVYHRAAEAPTPAQRQVELLRLFKQTLLEHGMASMDEYGDMLNWGLPSKDGVSRSLHVFDPGFCSFGDAHYGTVHYHGGEIRGTILAGSVWHDTYVATPDPGGDRFLGDDAYTLERHTQSHGEGATYSLPPMVAHWIRPKELTMTYFEEDGGAMGDLVNPATKETDEHVWTQEQADALLPRLLEMIEARLPQTIGASAASHTRR